MSRHYYKLMNDDMSHIKEHSRPMTTCISHPHNSYMQLLSETGLIGTSFVIIFFIFVTYKFLLNIFLILRGSANLLVNKLAFMYLSVFISLFPFVPTGNFFNNQLSIILYLPIGFIIYYEKLNDKQN